MNEKIHVYITLRCKVYIYIYIRNDKMHLYISMNIYQLDSILRKIKKYVTISFQNLIKFKIMKLTGYKLLIS